MVLCLWYPEKQLARLKYPHKALNSTILEVYFNLNNSMIQSCVSGEFVKVGFVQQRETGKGDKLVGKARKGW